MEISIDRDSGEPIYRQVVREIQGLIRSGSLPEGFRLPPERQLAKALGVNRSTIFNAYRELKALGLVDAHVGRGTTVLPPPSPPPAPPVWPEADSRIVPSMITGPVASR